MTACSERNLEVDGELVVFKLVYPMEFGWISAREDTELPPPMLTMTFGAGNMARAVAQFTDLSQLSDQQLSAYYRDSRAKLAGHVRNVTGE